MLSRRYYIGIANILRVYWLESDIPDSLISDFTRFFQQDNPRFDPQRFIEAIHKERIQS